MDAPQSRRKQADHPRDLQGLPPLSIWHPGYHVGYGLACVRGQKKPPCFCRCWLRWRATGWLGMNDRTHLFKHRGPSLVLAYASCAQAP